MTSAFRRLGVASLTVAAILTIAACGSDEPADAPEAARTTDGPATVTAGASPASVPTATAFQWSRAEQEFLDELSGFGFPTEMTASTTVEVGVGICQSIADGADDGTILERIGPLTSAIAAQGPEHDSAQVGHMFIEASRNRLCG